MSDRHREQETRTAGASLINWLRRLSLFVLLWWILTDGAADGWTVGVPVILIATGLSVSLWTSHDLSLVGILRFLPWFLYYSLVGATDVAIRAFKPRMPLHPGLMRQPLRLPSGSCRVMLANVVSMLAGTLSINLEEDDLIIHALDQRWDMADMVRDLEPRIAAIFGLRLDDEATPESA